MNALNGSTLLGLGIALAGRATVRRGPRGLLLAHGFGPRFPRASAFTVGDVVLTRHEAEWWTPREQLLAHEEEHAWQYGMLLGVPLLPAYGAAVIWSYLRGGDHWSHNVFEVRAGLEDGGYPLLSRREQQRQRRPGRTA